MGIYSLAKSGINNWIKYQNASAGNGQTSDFELISTQVLTSAQAAVTFANLQNYSQYKNLQIRINTRDTNTGTGSGGVWLQFNGDAANNYSWHRIGGGNTAVFSNGSASTSKMLVGLCAKSPDTTGVFGAACIDIFDFASTLKNKTVRSFTGNASSISTASMEVNLQSGAWYSTSAITSIIISSDTNFATGSRFSLYGVK